MTNNTNEMTQWLNEEMHFDQDVNGTLWDSNYDEDNQYYEDENDNKFLFPDRDR